MGLIGLISLIYYSPRNFQGESDNVESKIENGCVSDRGVRFERGPRLYREDERLSGKRAKATCRRLRRSGPERLRLFFERVAQLDRAIRRGPRKPVPLLPGRNFAGAAGALQAVLFRLARRAGKTQL